MTRLRKLLLGIVLCCAIVGSLFWATSAQTATVTALTIRVDVRELGVGPAREPSYWGAFSQSMSVSVRSNDGKFRYDGIAFYKAAINNPDSPFPRVTMASVGVVIPYPMSGFYYVTDDDLQMHGDNPSIYANVGFNLYMQEMEDYNVPAPGALPVFAAGLGALGFLAYRRQRKKAA